jgi:hypothetical protein
MPYEPTESACNICQTITTFRCNNCLKVFYCSRRCQRRDWLRHKLHCLPTSVLSVATASIGSSSSSGSNKRSPASASNISNSTFLTIPAIEEDASQHDDFFSARAADSSRSAYVNDAKSLESPKSYNMRLFKQSSPSTSPTHSSSIHEKNWSKREVKINDSNFKVNNPLLPRRFDHHPADSGGNSAHPSNYMAMRSSLKACADVPAIVNPLIDLLDDDGSIVDGRKRSDSADSTTAVCNHEDDRHRWEIDDDKLQLESWEQRALMQQQLQQQPSSAAAHRSIGIQSNSTANTNEDDLGKLPDLDSQEQEEVDNDDDDNALRMASWEQARMHPHPAASIYRTPPRSRTQAPRSFDSDSVSAINRYPATSMKNQATSTGSQSLDDWDIPKLVRADAAQKARSSPTNDLISRNTIVSPDLKASPEKVQQVREILGDGISVSYATRILDMYFGGKLSLS